MRIQSSYLDRWKRGRSAPSLLAAVLFLLVGMAMGTQSDCLRTSYPQLIGHSTEGHTYIYTTVFDSSSGVEVIYAGGKSSAANLNGDDGTNYRPIVYRLTGYGGYQAGRAILSQDNSNFFEAVTAMRLNGNYLYMILKNQVSNRPNLLLKYYWPSPSVTSQIYQVLLGSTAEITDRQFLLFSLNSKNWFVTGSSDSSGYLTFQTHTDSTNNLYYSSSWHRYVYDYERAFTRKSIRATTSYTKVHAMVWDSSNEQVYASFTVRYYSSNYRVVAGIMTFGYQLQDNEKAAINWAYEYESYQQYAPQILTWESGQRVVGFGSRFSDQSTSIVADQYQRFFIERTVGQCDYFFYYYVNTFRTRQMRYLDYKRSGSTIEMAVFDQYDGFVYIQKLTFSASSPYNVNDFSLTFQEMKIQSYCQTNGGGCDIFTAGWISNFQVGASYQDQFFYAGNKQNHFQNYNYQIGLITATTDSRRQCYDSQYSSDDQLSYYSSYSGNSFNSYISYDTNRYIQMSSSTFSNYMNSRSYSDSTTTQTYVVKVGSSSSGVAAYSNTDTSECVPWTDDFFYSTNYLTQAVKSSYTKNFDGTSDKLSITMRIQVFKGNPSQQGCGHRDVTYSLAKTSGNIPDAQVITFEQALEGKISTEVVTQDLMGNMSIASNVYEMTYSYPASTDTYRTGTNAVTRTVSFTITLTYKCYKLCSVTPTISFPYSANEMLWQEYFDDDASAKLTKNFGDDIGSFTLNDDCKVNTLSLFESDCSTAPQNEENFKQLTGYNVGDTDYTFEMNIDPAALYTYTMCLLVENGHEFSATLTFQVEVRCGDNDQYTIAPPTTLDATARNVEEYIDTTGHTFSFDEFTSTGERLCPPEQYQVYRYQSPSYQYYSGFTLPRTTVKTVTIADYIFANNLNTYEFYIRGYFKGGGIAYSDKITYKVVCGTETLSLATTTDAGGTTISQSTYWFNDQGWTDSDKLETIPNSVYSSHFLTDKSLCPVDEWEIWMDDGTFQWNSGSLSKVTSATTASRVQIDGYDASKTYDLTVTLHNGQDPMQNYYEKYIIRGFTKARHNTLKPVEIQIDYEITLDVCGWETVIEQTGDDIVLIKPESTYYVEIGMTRSITESFSKYTTDSTVWPTWTGNTGPQCDITNYDLTTDQSNHVIYPPQLNTENTYYKQLRSWDEATRTYTIDTADNTTRLGTETFQVRVKTRGNRYYYYPITTTIVCGREKVYHPTDVEIFTVQQNSTWDRLSYTTKGFYSDMPQLCNITKFTIEEIIDEFGISRLKETYSNTKWPKFQISNTGNFTVLNSTRVFNHYMVYISAETALIKSKTTHTLNVTVTPFFSTNTNSPPVFREVRGFNLPDQVVYIDHDYSKTPFQLPEIMDMQGNNVWIDLEQGKERTFVKYDNRTRRFNYMRGKIPATYMGNYRVHIQIGDDNWLGSMTNNYTLRFSVTFAPTPTIVAAPIDTSSKGVKIEEMGITGEVKAAFKDKMYLNLAKLRSRRLLESQNTSTSDNSTGDTTNSTDDTANSTNTTWVIHEQAEELPPIPDDLSNLEFPLELIDDRVFSVYVDPSPYQDVTKVNLTWVVESLDESSISFQVFYDHPEYISQEGLDILVIKIKDRTIFLSQEDGKQIFNDGFEIREKIRKQLPPPSTQKSEIDTKEISAENLQEYIDSKAYEDSVSKMETYSKYTIFGIMAWCFISGSKNLDFLWSYLGVLQVFGHLSLIRIQIPMNVIIMTKSLVSISVLDVKALQSSLLKNSFFDVQQYMEDIVAIIDPPNTKYNIKDVKAEISQYQFFEHEYRENLSFFDNLRSMKVLAAFCILFWVIAFIIYLLGKVIKPLGRHWFYRGLYVRCWNYMGVNAILRLLHVEFILVLFAGYVVYRKQLYEMYEKVAKGEVYTIEMSSELITLCVLLSVPLLATLIIPCCKKEYLRKKEIEVTFNTLYYKSNLRSFASKLYMFTLLFQRILVALVIIGIEDIVFQLEVLVLTNLFISWISMYIDRIYLDLHLRTFERFNQAYLSIVQISLLFFTDFVGDRQLQFNYGYLYSALLAIYNTISLGMCAMYALEPLTTWLRMRWMRLEQIRMAIELRARLIREAKERKEARKQKKLEAFNNFTINLGDSADIETDDGANLINKGRIENELGSIQEEQFEDTLNESLKIKDQDVQLNIENALNGLEQHDKELFGMDGNFGNNQETLMNESAEFDEEPYTEILDKLSLIDRTRYVQILKQLQKIDKMREELVSAEKEDDGFDLAESRKKAKDINKKHKEIVGKKALKKEKKKLEDHKVEEGEEEKNIEYWAMINALDAEMDSLKKEQADIEETNGVFNKTRETWKPKEEEDPAERVGIMDVFAVEIEN